jgi:hypothetical protein
VTQQKDHPLLSPLPSRERRSTLPPSMLRRPDGRPWEGINRRVKYYNTAEL